MSYPSICGDIIASSMVSVRHRQLRTRGRQTDKVTAHATWLWYLTPDLEHRKRLILQNEKILNTQGEGILLRSHHYARTFLRDSHSITKYNKPRCTPVWVDFCKKKWQCGWGKNSSCGPLTLPIVGRSNPYPHLMYSTYIHPHTSLALGQCLPPYKQPWRLWIKESHGSLEADNHKSTESWQLSSNIVVATKLATSQLSVFSENITVTS